MKTRLSLPILILVLSLLPLSAQAEDDGPVAVPVADGPVMTAAPPPAVAVPPPVDFPRGSAAVSASPPSNDASSMAQPAGPPVDVSPMPEPSLATARTVYKRRYNMALFGGALLLASYTADRLLMGDLSKSGFAWIPLAGPWFLLDLQLRQPVPSSATVLFLTLDGLLQAGGLTMTVLGLVLRERRLTVRLAAPAVTGPVSPAPSSAP